MDLRYMNITKEMTLMKKLLTHLVTFALGVGAGFLAGQKLLDAKYAALAQDEIDDVKETYYRMREEFQAQLRTPDPSADVESEKKSLRSKSSLDNLTRTNPYEDAKRNYNLLSKAEEEPPVMIAPPITDVDRSKPYRISDDEFNEEFDHHDKGSLYFYKKDGVLCEEAEAIVDDIVSTIGEEAALALEKEITVWVRNENLAMDYEIIGINKSYAEAVHGIVEESPKERHKRATTKKAKKNEQ
jgi:hypothetical protein